MLPQELSLKLEGKLYTADNITTYLDALRTGASSKQSKYEEVYGELLTFLEQWFSSSSKIEVQTSGSTGQAKRLSVRKEAMLRSAEMTCTTLGLGRGARALLCISPKYIGGMMMIVRAMLYEMELSLVAVQANPLLEFNEKLDFIALVPMQVQAIVEKASSRKKFEEIGQVIIGGASLSTGLLKELKGFPNAIYSTYGMTETLSHIALRRISGAKANKLYKALPNIQLSLSENNTLNILAPYISEEWLRTNDIVKLYEDNSFEVIGRIDNVVNSGGIKLQIESLEEAIKAILPQRLALTSIADERLGNALVLLLEGKEPKDNSEKHKSSLINRLKTALPPYSAPKHIIYCKAIPLTANGKIDRSACRKLVQSSIK